MKYTVSILLMTLWPCFGQQFNGAATGKMTAPSLTYVPPHSVYASRPGSPIANQLWIMDDTDCAGTASATPTQCKWSGSAWQATGGTGGGGAPSGPAGGDLGGTYPNPTLPTVNSNVGACGDSTHVGQVTLNAKGQTTACTAVAIPGLSTAITNPLQTLANLVVRTNSTVLTLLPNASSGTPYGFTIGATYNFTTTPTVTITSGSGSDTAYIYVDSGGTLTVGKNNLTMSCSGACTVVSGVTAFPEGSVHIATWTASSATWDTSGGTNFLGVASAVHISGGGVTWTGTGYTISGSGGGPTCTAFTVPYTSLTAAATTQEITIASSVAALTAFGAAYFSQDTNFSGGSATALSVSMGRTGSNNYEMSGGQVQLMSGGISTPYSFTPPSPLQTSSTYSVVLAFTSVGANLNTFTAGSLSGSLCAYSF